MTNEQQQSPIFRLDKLKKHLYNTIWGIKQLLTSNCLVVRMDANKNIYRKAIRQSLTSVEGLNMQEVVGEFTGKKIGPTFFRGTKPIDGVWATSNLVVTHACVMPTGFGVGDHRMFIIDFQESSMVGAPPPLRSSGSPPEGLTLKIQVE
jgi:hypothetical protein